MQSTRRYTYLLSFPFLCMFLFPFMHITVKAQLHDVWVHLGEPRWGFLKLLLGPEVTILDGRPVKTCPVLSGWTKVLLKRLFLGNLHVVKRSLQLEPSKRPSLRNKGRANTLVIWTRFTDETCDIQNMTEQKIKLNAINLWLGVGDFLAERSLLRLLYETCMPLWRSLKVEKKLDSGQNKDKKA